MPNALVTRRDCLGAVARFWQRTYATHHLTLLVLLALNITTQLFLHPFHRLFRLSDPHIQYPHADPETVSPLFLLIYAGIVPLCVIILWTVVARRGVHATHVSILGLLLSILTTTLLTDIVKNSVGRPRPDLLARCKPKEGTPKDVLVGVDVCTETAQHLLHDGWRSFPSGHSSSAFSGLGYLALFLAAQMGALRHSAPPPLALLPLVPIVGAALIAISRTEDYRHDVFDVTTGSVLGCVVALGAWRRYYPSLWERQAERPFPPPDVGIERRKDEEEFALGEDRGYERVESG